VYNAFYNLKDNPFRLTPDPSFIYMTSRHREALAGLVYSACTRPGLSLLIGEAGTGKTTLLYTLTALLEKRRFITAVCNNPTLTRQEFYDLLMVKLGIQCSSSLKSRQLMALQETLLRNRADGRPSVLIVDEAQRLPTELLEEIRLLLNIETPREKLLEIIMAGQPELHEMLRRPELRQLKQRVSCICKLEPLSFHDTREYLQHRLARAGLADQQLFPEPAIHAIYEYTQGIPRLVNSLCNCALQTGFALQSPRISVAIVREAARDLDLDDDELRGAALDENPDPLAASASMASAAIPAVPNGRGESNGTGDLHMPADAYTSRQKSISFIANLMDRWRS